MSFQLTRRRSLAAGGIAAALLSAGLGSAVADSGGSAAATAEGKRAADGAAAAVAIVDQATFDTGSGADRFRVAVSTNGNLTSFSVPAGEQALATTAREGYALCSFGGDLVHGRDTGSDNGGFGEPAIVQPKPGAFPITITRTTTDGKLRLKQVWSKPDAGEFSAAVTMTVTNTSSASLAAVVVTRSGDYDLGLAADDRAAASADSALAFDDRSDAPAAGAPVGVALTALTPAIAHVASVELESDWAVSPETREGCEPIEAATPTGGSSDVALRIRYELGALAAGKSKTVRVGYRHL